LGKGTGYASIPTLLWPGGRGETKPRGKVDFTAEKKLKALCRQPIFSGSGANTIKAVETP